MNYINVLVLENPEQHIGKKAILSEPHASWFVTIVDARNHNATVKHGDGQLQKTMWNRLLIESDENERRKGK